MSWLRHLYPRALGRGGLGIGDHDLEVLKEHEIEFVVEELRELHGERNDFIKLERAIKKNQKEKIPPLIKKLAREKQQGFKWLNQISYVNSVRQAEKQDLMSRVGWLMADIADELVGRKLGAVRKVMTAGLAKDFNRNPYFLDLVAGKCPVFSIIKGDSIRMQYKKGKKRMVITAGKDHISKKAGETVQQRWDKIGHKYNHKMRLYMETLLAK